jgi:(p)ppGpp synthase/HD superfamily hydrolase
VIHKDGVTAVRIEFLLQFKLLKAYNRMQKILVKTLGHTTRTNGKPQILGTGHGLASILTLQESINSCCLMTPGDFLVGSVVTGLHIALFRDDSSVHQGEHISWCLKGLGSG